MSDQQSKSPNILYSTYSNIQLTMLENREKMLEFAYIWHFCLINDSRLLIYYHKQIVLALNSYTIPTLPAHYAALSYNSFVVYCLGVWWNQCIITFCIFDCVSSLWTASMFNQFCFVVALCGVVSRRRWGWYKWGILSMKVSESLSKCKILKPSGQHNPLLVAV